MPTRPILASAVLALLLAACSAAPPAAPRPPSTPGSAAQSAPPPALPAGSWPTYYHDAGRSGVDPSAPAFTAPTRRWSTAISGDVYAEPLPVGDRVVVATEHDSVLALQASTGRVLWTTTVGDPVSGSDLPCGDIDPSGITSTPVIDPAAGTVWVVAFVRPFRHVLFGLDLARGEIRAQRVVDPPGSDSRVEQQRGALTLAAGRIYVPFGGLYGDCGDYHGYVVGIDSRVPASPLLVYQVPAGRQGGIWAPSGVTVASDGSLLVTTGNSGAASGYDGGNSVVRLSPELQALDSFTPTDAPRLNEGDIDLGSTGPVSLPGGLVFQIGKAGVGYFLRSDHLGGVGGQAYSGQACGGVLGSVASTGQLALVPCQDGLVALAPGAGPSFRQAWKAPNLTAGPPIVTGGTAWALDRSAGDIVALDVQTGAPRARVHVGRANRFATPGSGGGQVYVAAGGQLVALSE